MAEDKPMTIKERMAALAKASGSGGGAGVCHHRSSCALSRVVCVKLPVKMWQNSSGPHGASVYCLDCLACTVLCTTTLRALDGEIVYFFLRSCGKHVWQRVWQRVTKKVAKL